MHVHNIIDFSHVFNYLVRPLPLCKQLTTGYERSTNTCCPGLNSHRQTLLLYHFHCFSWALDKLLFTSSVMFASLSRIERIWDTTLSFPGLANSQVFFTSKGPFTACPYKSSKGEPCGCLRHLSISKQEIGQDFVPVLAFTCCCFFNMDFRVWLKCSTSPSVCGW